MKKFLLGAVGLVALGMAAPASAADLAARPYTKAPPPVVAPIYNWGGFYIGANGGYGSSAIPFARYQAEVMSSGAKIPFSASASAIMFAIVLR